MIGGIDFDFGSLTSHIDLADIYPSHMQNQVLTSTDVKASNSFFRVSTEKEQCPQHNKLNPLPI
jgi:hypothetical protein